MLASLTQLRSNNKSKLFDCDVLDCDGRSNDGIHDGGSNNDKKELGENEDIKFNY